MNAAHVTATSSLSSTISVQHTAALGERESKRPSKRLILASKLVSETPNCLTVCRLGPEDER